MCTTRDYQNSFLHSSLTQSGVCWYVTHSHIEMLTLAGRSFQLCKSEAPFKWDTWFLKTVLMCTVRSVFICTVRSVLICTVRSMLICTVRPVLICRVVGGHNSLQHIPWPSNLRCCSSRKRTGKMRMPMSLSVLFLGNLWVLLFDVRKMTN